jgi:periplasmic protein CpxP/Spy
MHTRTISMLLGAVLSTGVVLAQAPNQSQPSSAAQATQADHARTHHAPNPDRMANHLGKKLGLSSDQVNQIKPVLEDRTQKMQALRADTTLSQQDRRAKAHAIMQDSNTKIEAVLNDTQKQQFEQMMQERRAHRKAEKPQAQ